jgi:hypothetical protein
VAQQLVSSIGVKCPDIRLALGNEEGCGSEFSEPPVSIVIQLLVWVPGREIESPDRLLMSGVTMVMTPWDFRQPSKWRGLVMFRETDGVQSYQLVMRTELIHGVGLHLSLYNMQLSDCPLRHQMDPVEQRLVLEFHSSRASDTQRLTEHSARCLENAITDFRQRGDGFVNSRKERFPFAPAQTLANYFSISDTTIR